MPTWNPLESNDIFDGRSRNDLERRRIGLILPKTSEKYIKNGSVGAAGSRNREAEMRIALFGAFFAAALFSASTPYAQDLPPGLLPGIARPCKSEAPKGGIYLKIDGETHAFLPALYRTEEGSILEAFISNPAARWHFKPSAGSPADSPLLTLWIANAAQGCVWTYRLVALPPVAPARKSGAWPESPKLIDIDMRPKI